MDLQDALNIEELEQHALRLLPVLARDYYASGARDQLTLRDNRAAFERLRLHYRVLVDVSRRSLATTVLGEKLSMPIAVAPTAFHRMAHPEGELATAAAAGAAGTLMVVSSLSNTAIEDIVEAATGPVWFQLYIYKDRGVTEALAKRALNAGCSGLVVTVDAPLLGCREQDIRNNFQLPAGLFVENLLPDGMGALPGGIAQSGLAAYFSELIDQALSFRDVSWLAQMTDKPVLVKGVVRGDDAQRAVEHGAAGVIVSNHGGRQLDTSPATIDVLPEVVEAVAGKAAVLMDGGVRRGTDVLKAISLGAQAVLVGRPVLWGLACGGQAGVEHALGILRKELDLAMCLAGCSSVDDMTPDLVRPGRH